jgi:hypothetical protein
VTERAAWDLLSNRSRIVLMRLDLAFRAFTDPDHLATWWDPTGTLHIRAAATDTEV